MNRLGDFWPAPHRPHVFLAAGDHEGHDPLRPSGSVPDATLADKLVYTEADRRADTWRSLKATLATFAVLSTIFLTLIGLLMAIGPH
jgi:hypothetical protein